MKLTGPAFTEAPNEAEGAEGWERAVGHEGGGRVEGEVRLRPVAFGGPPVIGTASTPSGHRR